jgi:sigma-B regulation protein RsbU (phosphoserine phosphatase)
MSNAGALPPMICRGGEILKLRVEGVPLGLLEAREYEEVVFQARPGDAILLYSDGITDHIDSQNRDYGRARLAHVLSAGYGKPPAELIAAIFKDVDKFSPVAFDDQTIFAMKVL